MRELCDKKKWLLCVCEAVSYVRKRKGVSAERKIGRPMLKAEKKMQYISPFVTAKRERKKKRQTLR